VTKQQAVAYVPKHSPEALVGFMREFWEGTISHPFSGHERLWVEGWKPVAAFEVKPFDGRIDLGCIRTFERRKGHGTRALKWLCQLADKHVVTIVGEIKPVGVERPRLGVAELRQWYKRHGFEVTGRKIVRRPQC